MIPRELIDKYFSNECTEEERMQVLEYLRKNPEEWNKYMNEEDWDNFIANEELTPDVSEALFEEVSKQTFKKNRRVRMAWLAAAAVAILLIGSLWTYFNDGNTGIRRNVMKAGLSAAMAERKNSADTLMRVLLGDGSVVILSPGSDIRYPEPFVSDKNDRIVYLSGKALFEVATDKRKPFIVYADMLATRVLGTAFTVESFAESNVIKVKLHKGKVQVAGAETDQQQWKGNEVLRPGDELTFDKATMLASVKRYTPDEHLVKAGPAGSRDVHVRRPDLYTFDISPLSEVFDQLSVYYQVDIYYHPADIQNKYFSGKMHKTDSLTTILNDIALLNHLMIEKNNERYVIRKKD